MVPLAINAITTLPDTPVEVVAMVVTSLPLPLSLHLLLMTRYQPTKPDPIAMGRTLRTQGHPGIGVRLLFKLLYYPLSHVVLEKKKNKKKHNSILHPRSDQIVDCIPPPRDRTDFARQSLSFNFTSCGCCVPSCTVNNTIGHSTSKRSRSRVLFSP